MGDLILAARGLGYRYPGASEPAVRDVELDAAGGRLVAVVGPNGSGKTTLVRLLLGVLPPSAGAVTVLGRDVGAWHRRALARTVAVVAQREEPSFPLRVEQAVLFGRYPHLGPLGAPGPADRSAVQRALERCDVERLRRRWVNTLSGGEWQRVRIARALAQEPRVLILDEATANLDLGHEMEVFELTAALARDHGLSVVLVTHHVNLAARFADWIVVLDRGSPRASGEPAVLTGEVLEEVFAWPVALTDWHGTPQYVPLRRGESASTSQRPEP